MLSPFTIPAQNAQAGPTRRPKPELKSSLCALSGLLQLEKSDACPIVARLNAGWRVIVCKHSIQWILQVRHGASWRGVCFCRTREGLVQCVGERAGEIGGDALMILLRLPERFPEVQP